jgi:hypothetical protein
VLSLSQHVRTFKEMIGVEFELCPHRQADVILEQPRYKKRWNEIKSALKNITDEDIIKTFEEDSPRKSISLALNELIKTRLNSTGWISEADIFADPKYQGAHETKWRLDFACDLICIEVAFNHGEATSWNLLKPVFASELNHVKKQIQTEIGVVIFATEEMKTAGGFDSAVGTFEKAITYLKPMNNLLTPPIMLVGLKAPKTFKIIHQQVGNRHIGHVERI